MIDAVENRTTSLPRLTDSLSSCIRWRQTDLDEALAAQLEMLEGDPWANAQRTSELILSPRNTVGLRCNSTTAPSAVQ